MRGGAAPGKRGSPRRDEAIGKIPERQGELGNEEFARRIPHQIDAVIENQARFSEMMLKGHEALAGFMQVARQHDEQTRGAA